MPIFADDLHLYAAERMTDLDNGGGLPSGTRILDGADNAVFPDIASGDRIAGRTFARKLFAAVPTEAADTLLAARVYLSSWPGDPDVSYALLDTGAYADQRAEMLESLYTAAQQDSNTNLRLYQTYYAGDSSIVLYAYTNQTTPVNAAWLAAVTVGTLLCLEDGENRHYLRITDLSRSTVGTYQALNLAFTPPLHATFQGGFNSATTYVTPTQIYTTRATSVLPALYGITTLAVGAALGDYRLRVAEIETPIAPTLTQLFEGSFTGSASTLPVTKAVAPVDSRLQSTTLDPMPDLSAITVRYPGGALSGATSPGLFTVAGTTISVLLPSSPMQSAQYSHVPTSTVITTETAALRWERPVLPGSVRVAAFLASNSEYHVGIDDSEGAISETEITGTVDYDTGAIDLTFAHAVTLATATITATALETRFVYGESAIQVTNYTRILQNLRTLDSVQISVRRVSDNALLSATSGPHPPILTARTHAPIVPIERAIFSFGIALLEGSVQVTVRLASNNVAHYGTDDGEGAISETEITGTVDYDTGAIDLTFAHAVTLNNSLITAIGLGTRSIDGDDFTPITEYSTTLQSIRNLNSFQISARRVSDNALLSATSNESGVISGTGISGNAIYQTGFDGSITLNFSDAVYENTLSITYDSYNYLNTVLTNDRVPLATYSATLPLNQGALVPESFTIAGNTLPGDVAVSATSNGSGVISGTGISGTINVSTGALSLTFADDVQYSSLTVGYQTLTPSYASGIIRGTGISSGMVSLGGFLTLNFSDSVYLNTLSISYPATVALSQTLGNDYVPLSTYSATVSVPEGVLVPGSFTISGRSYPEAVAMTATDDGQGVISGTGISGTINYATGELSLTFADDLLRSSLRVDYQTLSALGNILWQYATQATGTDFTVPLPANLTPGALTVQAAAADDAALLTGADDGQGAISGTNLSGVVDYASGQVTLEFTEAVTSSSLQLLYRYTAPTAVTPSLSDSLDWLRIPASRAFPMLRPGDGVRLQHPLGEALPNPVTPSAVYPLSRSEVSQIWLEDTSGLRLPTALYQIDLLGGQVTMASSLDLSMYTQPLIAWHSIEEEAVVITVDANNRQLELDHGLRHAFPAHATSVSGLVPLGDLSAALSVPFSQQAWTSVWDDERIGNPITPQFNQMTYPITVTNSGALTERWRIQFSGATTVDVIGETLGQIATGLSTTAEIAPINPRTRAPYFAIPSAGWGGGWVSGHLLRFNTTAAHAPFWVLSCVQPGASPLPGTPDRFHLTFTGDVDA